MAQFPVTYTSYDAKGLREDLQNKIYMLTPEDTPFISNIGRGRAKAVRHEWQTDVLAAPSLTNAYVEGDEYTYAALAPTVRVGNLTQISRKTILISGTLEAVDKAGRSSEMRMQASKAGSELKKDMEATLLANQASVVGNTTTPRKLGGFAAWLTTNAQRGGGANGGYSVGTGLVAAHTSAGPRDFTETLLKAAHKAAFEAGGNPKMAMMSPGQKVRFSAFPGIAAMRKNVEGKSQATIIGAADMYVGDFGNLSTVVNRVQQTNTVFLVDPSMVRLTTLRPMFIDKPAKTGDAEKRVMVVEYTLGVDNEAAHASINDLNP